MTERDVGTEDIKFVRLAIEKAKELLLFARADVIEFIDRFGLFEQRVILLVVRQARIVKDHHL